MKRFLALLSLFALAGCEQKLPPDAAGLKIIAARTAKGPRNTKLETKTQPDPPRAGQISVWDLKVFDIHDKPDKTRKEWKFFNALPQSSSDKSITGVLMNTWLISKDGSVFLPQKPLYKEYGSFLTDWTIPSSGPYTLWVEYQPVIAKDELSLDDLKKARILPVEHAHWDVSVGGAVKSSALRPSEHGGALGVYSLDSSDYGASASFHVALDTANLKSKQTMTLRPTISPQNDSISDESFTALSPDGETLLHSVGSSPQLTFPVKGKWRAWYSFALDGKLYVAPLDLNVA